MSKFGWKHGVLFVGLLNCFKPLCLMTAVQIKIHTSEMTLDSVIWTPAIPVVNSTLAAYFTFNSIVNNTTYNTTLEEYMDGSVPLLFNVSTLTDETGGYTANATNLDVLLGPTMMTPACPQSIYPFQYILTTGSHEGTQRVTVMGSNFVDSQFLKCRIGKSIGPGTYVSSEEVLCDVPDLPFSCKLEVEVLNNGVLESDSDLALEQSSMVLSTNGMSDAVIEFGTCPALKVMCSELYDVIRTCFKILLRAT